SQMSTAMDVYAFDALIQNIDRRRQNPNLATQGDEIVLFDHECAFSFLLAIFPSPEPWDLSREAYLAEHVFRVPLQGSNSLQRVRGSLQTPMTHWTRCTSDMWVSMTSSMPVLVRTTRQFGRCS